MRRLRGLLIALLLAAVTATACDSGSPAPSAGASSPSAQATAATYLALGDSVVFGTDPARDRADAAQFVGYPTYVARTLGLRLVNAACPGEASGGFLSPTGTDNVCRPYRSAYPLHVSYSGTQEDFAVAYLRAHPQTRLVTLTLGANDLFACQRDTPGHCLGPGELTTALGRLSANLDTALRRIRDVYPGRIVVLTYYDPQPGNGAVAAGMSMLNGTLTKAAATVGADVADGYSAFQRAAQAAGGDACAAGLLARTAGGGCDIHPSRQGAQVLAHAISDVVTGASAQETPGH